ncbi:DUF6883 domain-containing protein [Hymenobacter sp. UYCo722]|uniref:DUF6883 domain-containing protein n=1 Tax=Hymenobacter sp. UYCo722 TaxID=3156335 RepID=UPI003394C644
MTLHDKPLFVAANKVQDYLLNPDHPIGGAKARFFLGIGYSREHYEQLIADLIAHGHTRTVTEEKESPYGVKFVVMARCWLLMAGSTRCAPCGWNNRPVRSFC